MTDTLFHSFSTDISGIEALSLYLPFLLHASSIGRITAEELQTYLESGVLQHNFGLGHNCI